jgi:DNA-binding FadR family transcriptional regulator
MQTGQFMMIKWDKPDLGVIDPSRRASLKRKCPDVVSDLIRNHIFQAGLHPGDRLPQESELIEMFRCSRSTIREALKSVKVRGARAEHDRPAEAVHGSHRSPSTGSSGCSATISILNPSAARRSIRPVDLIEPELAFSVVGHLTKAHFQALEKTSADQEEHHPRSTADWEHHRHAEIDFHDILIDACPNPLLGLVCRFVNEAIRHLIGRHGEQEFSAAFTIENIDFHKRLLSAFRSSNAVRAARDARPYDQRRNRGRSSGRPADRSTRFYRAVTARLNDRARCIKCWRKRK